MQKPISLRPKQGGQASGRLSFVLIAIIKKIISLINKSKKRPRKAYNNIILCFATSLL